MIRTRKNPLIKKALRKIKRECTNKQILFQLRRSLQTPEQKRTRRMLLRIQTGKILCS